MLLPSHPRGVARSELEAYLRSVKTVEVISYDLLPFRNNLSITEMVVSWHMRYARNPLKLAKWRYVPVERIRATEPTMYSADLLYILSGQALNSPTFKPQFEATPWGVRLGRYLYLINGRHRTWLAAALGQRYMPLRVFNGNYYFRSYPLKQSEFGLTEFQHQPIFAMAV